jgi:hypothetical protein
MKTNEDQEREQKDMEGAFKYMDSEEGKKATARSEQIMKEIEELEKNDEVMYPITKRMIQDIAEEEICRTLNEDEIFLVLNKISWQIDDLLNEAIEEVNTMSERWERAIPEEEVETVNPRYEIFWKNEIAYHSEFSLICAFTDEDDARYYTQEQYDGCCEEYKIEKVDGTTRQMIVHHKNPLNGGDGFHMDVHDEPKSLQNRHDLGF